MKYCFYSRKNGYPSGDPAKFFFSPEINDPDNLSKYFVDLSSSEIIKKINEAIKYKFLILIKSTFRLYNYYAGTPTPVIILMSRPLFSAESIKSFNFSSLIFTDVSNTIRPVLFSFTISLIMNS